MITSNKMIKFATPWFSFYRKKLLQFKELGYNKRALQPQRTAIKCIMQLVIQTIKVLSKKQALTMLLLIV